MLRDQRLELADELSVATERQVGLDPLLERGQPHVLEPPRLDARKRLLAELRERRPAPESKRLPQQAATRAPDRRSRASATSRSNRCRSTASGSTSSR